MIKFRKGNLITQATPALPETVLAPAVATPMAPAASSKKWQSDQINLEWWQTPLKFKRRDVDTLEIDSINVSLMTLPIYFLKNCLWKNFKFIDIFSQICLSLLLMKLEITITSVHKNISKTIVELT